MFACLFGPIRYVVRALAADASPRQLAFGFALGVVIGLIPKGNLTALLFVIVLVATRVNIGAGLASASVFSWFGFAIDPFAHKLGWLVLSHRPLQSAYAWAHDAPLVAWTDLNNTVVLGQLLIGLFLAIPAYLIGVCVFARLQPWAVTRVRRYWIGRTLLGSDIATRWSPS